MGSVQNALERLDLRGNSLQSLPETIGQLTNLRRLHVEAELLESLPLDLLPPQVKVLDIYHGMEVMPRECQVLRELEAVLGEPVPIKSNYHVTWKNFGVVIDRQTRHVITLSLYQKKLRSLPESIGDLTQLKELYLYGNQLESLPETIGQLTNLRRLDLRNNQLQSLPETIGQLRYLQELRLEGNRLSSLPRSIDKLIWLQV